VRGDCGQPVTRILAGVGLAPMLLPMALSGLDCATPPAASQAPRKLALGTGAIGR
jgi:hypothetical protein